jgi:hypothetical protein
MRKEESLLNLMLCCVLLTFWIEGWRIEIQAMGWMILTMGWMSSTKKIQSTIFWNMTKTSQINTQFKSSREKKTT